MKKKRILSILLSVLLILSMLPVSVLAEGTESADGETACVCETLCTEDSVNSNCPVCGAEGADLFQCLGTGEGETEPAKEAVPYEEIPACICETLCTEESINTDCPVCGAEGADLTQCTGTAQETEASSVEENADETPERTEPANEIDIAVADMQNQIDALPTAEALAAMSLEEQQAVYEQVQTAYDAYNVLTDEQKAQITGAEKLDSLFEVFNSMVNDQSHTCAGIENGAINAVALTDTSATLDGGNYYLEKDIKLNNRLTISGTVTLCLNGHILEGCGTDTVIYVRRGATFTLCDCNSSACDHPYYVDNNGLYRFDGAQDPTGTIAGGVITGGTGYTLGNDYGGAIYIESSSITGSPSSAAFI